MGLCSFDEIWLEVDEFKDWLRKVPENKHKAYCERCKCYFSLGSMGIGAVKSHHAGSKHLRRIEAAKGVIGISAFCSRPTTSQSGSASTSSETVTVSSPASSVTSSACPPAPTQPTSAQPSVATSISTGDVLKAEVTWTLKCIASHYSYKSNDDSALVFQTMFPDSKIATRFTCGEKKTSYLTAFGIGPFLQDKLKKKIEESTNVVLLFDESLNKELQEKQMDLHVRLWDVDCKVRTYYLESFFLGHARASNILEKLDQALTKKFSHRQILQLSMDGPNVNKRVHEDLQSEIRSSTAGMEMLDIGTCGLHTLHNAFKSGVDAAGWCLDVFLRSIYYLFHDSPARREDFLTVAESSYLPKKFVSHRWLENVAPAERAIEILPNVVAYCSAAKNRTVPEPTCKSFQEIMKMVGDPLLKAKLQFFITVAKDVETFLRVYQTDAPMVPFLGTDLGILLKRLLSRFIKPDVMGACTSVLSLTKLQFEKRENHKDSSNIDIGFSAKLSLKSLNLSDQQRRQFRLDCREFLVAVIKKMIDKSPIKSKLVRSLTWLDPRLLAKSSTADTEKRIENLDITLGLMRAAGRVKEGQCDNVRREYTLLSQEVALEYASEFQNFNPATDRLDELLAPILSKKQYNSLWPVVKQLLLLSHGQATVERGFSTNKEVTADSLSKKSLVARRLICDELNKYDSPALFPITKEVLTYASSARHKYDEYLEQQKKLAETAKKRKAEEEVVEQRVVLQAKRRKLNEDIEGLEKSANKKAVDAETQENFQLLMESNALRKKVGEKKAELKTLDEKIKGMSSS